jgi:hypothetical protein
MTTTINHAQRRVFVKLEGPITLNDIRTHLEEERVGDGLSYDELIDARGISSDFSQQDVRMIADVLRRLAIHSRIGPTAVIVDSDVEYGMLRMLGILIEDVCRVQPFRRQEEAEQWLANLSKDVT